MRKSVTADAADMPEKIFTEAVKVFRQKGYHAASMQNIADAVGLQKGSLYHYILALAVPEFIAFPVRFAFSQRKSQC